MLSPARRRRAIEHVMMVMDVSEQHVCQLAGQHRSTQRRTAPPDSYRDKLVARMRELAVANPSMSQLRSRRPFTSTVVGHLNLSHGRL